MADYTVHLVYLAVEFHIPHAQSLKSKRKVVKSIKDRLMNRFNASVAEVGYQNEWQRCVIGMALLSNDKQYLHKQLDAVRQLFDERPEINLLNVETEWL